MAAKGKKDGGRGKFGSSLLLIFGLFAALVFLPTAVMLVVALLPTLAAGISDRRTGQTQALTIGAMNIAGVTPFLLQLWSSGHVFANALGIIFDPWTIVVIYTAAGIGWVIDWALTGIVATIMQQKGVGRLKDIAQQQDALIKRWGREVTGDMPLDSYGFPVTDGTVGEVFDGGDADDDEDGDDERAGQAAAAAS